MIKGQKICGLDIGTNSIKVLVAIQGAGSKELEIVGQAEVPNSGMRKGVVIKPLEVSRNIRQALDFCREGRLEGREKKGTSAVINIGGSHLAFLPSRGLASVSRADQKISEIDVERALQASRTISLPANQEILDVFPQEFIIDGQAGIKEVEGLRGIRLEAKTLCLTVFSPYLKNLTDAVLASDVEAENVLPSILASAQAVVSPQEKELGVAVMEIGAGTTGLAVFEEGSLVHAAIFPLGSNNITNDIAIVLKIEIDEAEEIKKEFSLFSLKKISLGRNKRKSGVSFPAKIVTRVVEARTKEIFQEVNKELKRINKNKLPGGIVLTGGGAKMARIVDLAKKEMKLPGRLGLPQGFSPSLDDPTWATAAGLVLEGERGLEDEEGLSFSEKGVFKKIKGIFKIFSP
ncbi:MAG: cell division protein FtsA [Candidatus Nealsonbacteria bacterium]|nr:cell division protein FtsA [Candidatus Nealsonbacteria bacterium]